MVYAGNLKHDINVRKPLNRDENNGGIGGIKGSVYIVVASLRGF